MIDVLSLFALGAASPSQLPITLCGRTAPSVAAFSAALRRDVRRGKLKRLQEKQMIGYAYDPNGLHKRPNYYWTETEPSHPAHPSLVCVAFTKDGLDGLLPEIEFHCAGPAAACSDLKRRFTLERPPTDNSHVAQ